MFNKLTFKYSFKNIKNLSKLTSYVNLFFVVTLHNKAPITIDALVYVNSTTKFTFLLSPYHFKTS